MVRQVVICLLSLLLLSSCATRAFADETVEVQEPTTRTVYVNSSGTDSRLDTLINQMNDVQSYVVMQKNELEKKQQDEAAQVVEPVEETEPQDVTLLRDISTQLSTIAGNTAAPAPTEAVPVKADSGISLVAYGNVSPTSQYANYAIGLLPKVAWNQDYVFLSVTNSEYYMIWGDLSIDGSVITGNDCHFTRWYYSNQQVGTLMQTGTANVRVDGGSYTMLSSLGDYPVLGNGSEILRKEVGFYAVVAACLFSLRFVWAFIVRLRGAVSIG